MIVSRFAFAGIATLSLAGCSPVGTARAQGGPTPSAMPAAAPASVYRLDYTLTEDAAGATPMNYSIGVEEDHEGRSVARSNVMFAPAHRGDLGFSLECRYKIEGGALLLHNKASYSFANEGVYTAAEADSNTTVKPDEVIQVAVLEHAGSSRKFKLTVTATKVL